MALLDFEMFRPFTQGLKSHLPPLHPKNDPSDVLMSRYRSFFAERSPVLLTPGFSMVIHAWADIDTPIITHQGYTPFHAFCHERWRDFSASPDVSRLHNNFPSQEAATRIIQAKRTALQLPRSTPFSAPSGRCASILSRKARHCLYSKPS